MEKKERRRENEMKSKENGVYVVYIYPLRASVYAGGEPAVRGRRWLSILKDTDN